MAFVCWCEIATRICNEAVELHQGVGPRGRNFEILVAKIYVLLKLEMHSWDRETTTQVFEKHQTFPIEDREVGGYVSILICTKRRATFFLGILAFGCGGLCLRRFG